MTSSIHTLNSLSSDKLIDVVKNYKQYGYDKDLRELAISILEDRGITKEELQLTGNLNNETFDNACQLLNKFKLISKTAFLLYLLFLITSVFAPILDFNSEALGLVFSIINVLTLVLYLGFLVKSFIIQQRFYKNLNQSYGAEGAFLYLLLGMPFYLIMYFYFRNQMRETMKLIR